VEMVSFFYGDFCWSAVRRKRWGVKLMVGGKVSCVYCDVTSKGLCIQRGVRGTEGDRGAIGNTRKTAATIVHSFFMKLELCCDIHQPITIVWWGQPSAEAFSCSLTVVQVVCIVSISVQCSIVTFYHLAIANLA
jgi:hypothetical protein